ncbi:hypothetical protein CFSAN001075_13818 [Salmonella enterica subsp. enterica serovar Hartford str. CFSAN001075]|nr:hypothetical protein CFSAN001075_13818 [Salmonella enterica subsp. enterica serovar Hartford str. CFSAN001075]
MVQFPLEIQVVLGAKNGWLLKSILASNFLFWFMHYVKISLFCHINMLGSKILREFFVFTKHLGVQ